MKVEINSVEAPDAIGPYSQAINFGQFIVLSGQIGLHPDTMELENSSFTTELRRVFSNIEAVLKAAELSINHVVKLTIYLTDIGNFSMVNAVMAELFSRPYPARAVVEVSNLPRGAAVEIETIAGISD